MVGYVGNAPTKAVRPGNLQSPAIAAMRYSQKLFILTTPSFRLSVTIWTNHS